jgi:hypothetical protein
MPIYLTDWPPLSEQIRVQEWRIELLEKQLAELKAEWLQVQPRSQHVGEQWANGESQQESPEGGRSGEFSRRLSVALESRT